IKGETPFLTDENEQQVITKRITLLKKMLLQVHGQVELVSIINLGIICRLATSSATTELALELMVKILPLPFQLSSQKT
ncbi:MAG TPA: hypothetical protein PKZ53_26155, partial [Acidobacteriota bacterium]|nr:hypothetical protein [Acidobacteriota bacterium]